MVHLCLRVVVVPRMQKMWTVQRNGRKNGCFVVWAVKSVLLFALAVLPDTHPQPHTFSLLCLLTSSSFVFFDETEYDSWWLLSNSQSPVPWHREQRLLDSALITYCAHCRLYSMTYYSEKFHGKLGVFRRRSKTCWKDRERTDQNGGMFFFVFHLMLSLLSCGAVSVTRWMFSLSAVIIHGLQSQHIK